MYFHEKPVFGKEQSGKLIIVSYGTNTLPPPNYKFSITVDSNRTTYMTMLEKEVNEHTRDVKNLVNKPRNAISKELENQLKMKVR